VTDVPFPEVSQQNPDAEGVLATWFVADGDRVAAGDLIAEVAVDKLDMEVPAPAAGTIHLLTEEGAVVKQGTPVARIE
jgi:pyruvate/2-oxoglutarate dehydrogenase complex dihydrolipoamide acyltransferase (E2) component